MLPCAISCVIRQRRDPASADQWRNQVALDSKQIDASLEKVLNGLAWSGHNRHAVSVKAGVQYHWDACEFRELRNQSIKKRILFFVNGLCTASAVDMDSSRNEMSFVTSHAKHRVHVWRRHEAFKVIAAVFFQDCWCVWHKPIALL